MDISFPFLHRLTGSRSLIRHCSAGDGACQTRSSMEARRKPCGAEEIIGKLRAAEVGLAHGQPVGQVVRRLGVGE